MRKLLTWPTAFSLLVFLVAYVHFYINAMPLFSDSDTPWHIMAGYAIRDAGGLPEHDPWAFVPAGQPWYNISWLWDIGLSYLDQWGGAKLLFIFAALCGSVIMAMLSTNISLRKETGSDAKILTLLIAALVMMEFVSVRPQMASCMAIILFHRWLHQSRVEENSRMLWWLPFIMALWVNIHGSFFVGFILLGAYGVEALWYRRRAWFKHLFAIGLVCLLAFLANPYGIHLVTAILRTLDSVISKNIQEWMPFVFGKSLGISAWLMIFILASSLREKTIPLADKILSVTWLVAMFFSIRNSAVFLLVSAPYMAISLQRFADALAHVRTERADVLEGLAKPRMAQKLAAAAVVLVAASALLVDVLKGEKYRVDPEKDAGAEIAQLIGHYADKRILNDYGLGGRIIYESKGRMKLFVDGRAGTAYSEELLADYLDFLFQNTGWQKVIDKYDIDGVFIRNASPFAAAYDNGQYHDQWRRVYEGKQASLYLLVKPGG